MRRKGKLVRDEIDALVITARTRNAFDIFADFLFQSVAALKANAHHSLAPARSGTNERSEGSEATG